MGKGEIRKDKPEAAKGRFYCSICAWQKGRDMICDYETCKAVKKHVDDNHSKDQVSKWRWYCMFRRLCCCSWC